MCVSINVHTAKCHQHTSELAYTHSNVRDIGKVQNGNKHAIL